MKLPNLDARYRVWMVCVTSLGLLPAFAGYVGAAWELSQLCGLAGFIACIVLSGAPIRPRKATPRSLLSVAAHSWLGWLALGAVVLHIGGLLFSDHRVLEYLMATAPLYQLAGIAAAILLIVVTLSAIAGSRRGIWGNHRSFQATHVTLSAALLWLCALHVIVTGRYAGNLWSRCLIIAAVAGGPLLLLRARSGREDNVARQGLSRRLVFGRHSLWVLSILLLTAAATAALALAAAGIRLREPLAQRRDLLPLDFPHRKHIEVSCATCHHNFVDNRGLDACIQCHRDGRAELKVGIEARFHGFCFQCHRHPGSELDGHGPVSGCTSCHRHPSPID